jgi:hypothetical protein
MPIFCWPSREERCRRRTIMTLYSCPRVRLARLAPLTSQRPAPNKNLDCRVPAATHYSYSLTTVSSIIYALLGHGKNSTPAFSMPSALFYEKHPGGGTNTCQLQIQKIHFAAKLEREVNHAMPELAVKSIAPQTRCAHHFPASGRQCRLLASDSQSGLCAHHLAKKKTLEKDADFFFPLMRRSCRFQSAQAINYSLNHLYELVATRPHFRSPLLDPRLHQQLAPPHSSRR